MHPTGPQSPGVYWVRRAAVLVVLLVLLLGVRWLLTGRGGGTPSATPTPSQSSSSSQSSTPTTRTWLASAKARPVSGTRRRGGPTSRRSGTVGTSIGWTPTSTSPKPTSTGTVACTKSQISVTASTDAASYPVGSTPHLRMKIENTSSTPCTRDIGASQNELLITSGTARVWSSDDCSPGGGSQVVTMAPGQSYSVAVTWLGKLSAKGCPANQPAATKGTYKLTGRNGDVTSAPAVFALT